jgi:hypothetical protein
MLYWEYQVQVPVVLRLDQFFCPTTSTTSVGSRIPRFTDDLVKTGNHTLAVTGVVACL